MTIPLRSGLLALLLSFLAVACEAATYSTNAFSDALVTVGPGGSLSGNNYGGAGALSVAASGLPKGEFQSVLMFDLSGARNSFDAQFGAGQWNVQAIKLHLTAVANNNPSFFNTTASGQFGISLMRNNSWLEGSGSPIAPTTDGITFNSLQNTYIDNANDELLGTFSFNGASSGATDYSLSLSPGLVADLMDGDSLSLRLFSADPNVSYLFNSRSVANAANRPQLIIEVPEPGSLALLMTGVAGLFLGRRFRNGAR